MKECKECGAAVSARFARVLGSREDEALACFNCSTSKEIFDGAAARRAEP